MARMLRNLEQGKRIFAGYDGQYQCFTDLTLMTPQQRVEGNRYFREMDRDYPGSYFILNSRRTDDWLASRMRHADGRMLRWEMAISGLSDPAAVAALWQREKEDHERNVRSYFAGNPRFAEIDIDSQDVTGQVSRLVGRTLDATHWTIVGATGGKSSPSDFDRGSARNRS